MPQIIGFMQRKVKFYSEKSAAETEIITITKFQRYATIKSIKHLAVIVKTVKQNFTTLQLCVRAAKITAWRRAVNCGIHRVTVHWFPANCNIRSPHLKFCFAKGGLLTLESLSYAAKQQVFHCWVNSNYIVLWLHHEASWGLKKRGKYSMIFLLPMRLGDIGSFKTVISFAKGKNPKNPVKARVCGMCRHSSAG